MFPNVVVAASLTAVSVAIASEPALARGATVPKVEFYFSGIPFASDSAGTLGHAVAGSGAYQSVLTTTYNARPMGVTVDSNHIYWANYAPGDIWRSDLSGVNEVRLSTPGHDIRNVVVYDGMLYWGEPATGVIKRANLDGSGQETVVSGHAGAGETIWDFAISNDRFYWVSNLGSAVSTSRMDGSDYHQYQVGMDSDRAISIDADDTGIVVGMYGDRSNPNPHPHRIWRLSLDGQQRQVLAEIPLASRSEVASVSVFNGRAYYAWLLGGNSLIANISSVPLSGGPSELEFSITNEVQIYQIDVVPTPSSGGFIFSLGLLASRRKRRPLWIARNGAGGATWSSRFCKTTK